MPTSFPGAKQTFPSAAALVGAPGDTMNSPNNQPALMETLGDTVEALQDAFGFGATNKLNITASDGSGTRYVIWVGTTDPGLLALEGDLWVAQGKGLQQRQSSAWVIICDSLVTLLGTAPADADVPTGQAVLYWDAALQLVKVKGRDGLGVLYTITVGSSGLSGGSTIDELQITASLQSITGTAGTYTDLSIASVLLAVTFVAPTNTTRLEWGVAPVLIQTATAVAPLNWRVIEGGVRTISTAPGGQVPNLASGQVLPGLTPSPREVPTVAGNTYTWKLQVQLPGTGTATFAWFAVATDNPTFLRVKAA